jgi:hypothetical protein
MIIDVTYKTIATYGGHSPDVVEKITKLRTAQALLKDACRTFRQIPGYDVTQSRDNMSAVIRSQGYCLEITVVPK